jgi:hypothetical protein
VAAIPASTYLQDYIMMVQETVQPLHDHLRESR